MSQNPQGDGRTNLGNLLLQKEPASGKCVSAGEIAILKSDKCLYETIKTKL